MQIDMKIDNTTPIMPIGAMADTLGVHQRTLRIYDAEGILSPTRTGKNRRCYSLDDLERARFIIFLTRNLSINIAGVKIILKLLQDNKIAPSNYISYVNKIAKSVKIDKEAQLKNVEKNAKKGKRKN